MTNFSVDTWGGFGAGVLDAESMYWMRFVNKVLVASRTGLACLIIGALITYVPTKALLSRMLAFTTYAPTIAISACDATLGRVMSNIWAIMQVALFVMIVTMIAFQIWPLPMPRAHMLAFIFFSSFLVTVSKRVNMTGKKVGLAQICMTFIAANLDPHLDVVMMPLRFMASIFVGATAALLALIFPYPQLATMEVIILDKICKYPKPSPRLYLYCTYVFISVFFRFHFWSRLSII